MMLATAAHEAAERACCSIQVAMPETQRLPTSFQSDAGNEPSESESFECTHEEGDVSYYGAPPAVLKIRTSMVQLPEDPIDEAFTRFSGEVTRSAMPTDRLCSLASRESAEVGWYMGNSRSAVNLLPLGCEEVPSRRKRSALPTVTRFKLAGRAGTMS
ncbi:unnamed protein product [Polarella glacialis]|uniref:Uncharacterized protein n=1 Tax=Polarella glacialis TaxID=89957 RepID=A0A813EQ26_POLGL|nr:unnamed protein product [Polarella glacialis]CAE8665355.1 unnamed protein product [Polarella glacialis]|mmetsp:Transcript_20771/g.33146  ORF Transcript_20771/g.33146 Transcript_20771/m.33146 type:complete len:158 (-) Transcript_20771:284-757(-)